MVLPMNKFRSWGLIGSAAVILFVFSGLAFALNQSDPTSPQLSTSPTLVSPQNIASVLVEKAPTVRHSSRSASLTTSEMVLVLNSGRNFDPVSKKWSVRPALSGLKRENFLLSWEVLRRKSLVNQLLPSKYLMSE